ncbi:MAG: LemA family protein [Bacteroidales bacterium]|nr:LemA family protein [Bacteroidales bacterium]MDD3201217.1 LemA family protein [Bacteroidales bacterium]
MITIIVIVAIVAILVLWFISVQRKLVSKEELCKNSLSQIGVQMSSRWDALTALAELTKGYSEHEYNTLKDIIAQRKNITSSSSVNEANAQESMLAQAMSRFNLVVEQYPDLKAQTIYSETMASVNTYENQVRMSRMVFNDSVTIFNRIVRQFPDSFVASMLGFKSMEYLVENPAKTEMPSMNMSANK